MIVSELKQHCPHQVTLGNTTLFPCSVINEELFKITLCKNVTWAFTTRGQLFISEAFSVAVENYSGFCYCFALDLISSLQSSVGSFWEFVLVVKRSSFQVLQSLFDVPFTQTPVLYGCCFLCFSCCPQGRLDGWYTGWLTSPVVHVGITYSDTKSSFTSLQADSCLIQFTHVFNLVYFDEISVYFYIFY